MYFLAWIVGVGSGLGLVIWIVAVGSFFGLPFLWDLAVVAFLRFLGFQLPYSVAFLWHRKWGRELRAVLKGASKLRYVLMALLLFAFPFSLGFAAYYYVIERFTSQRLFRPADLLKLLVYPAVIGVFFGLSEWRKSRKEEIGAIVSGVAPAPPDRT